MPADDLTKLIEGARAGRSRDLSRLSGRFQKMILLNCSLQLDDVYQAEDAAQEVVEKMVSGIASLKSPEAFTAWLQRIILTTCQRYNQRTKKQALRELHLDAPGERQLLDQLVERNPDIQPETHAEQKESRERIFAAIHRLPEMQRQALVLHYYGELSYREIAEIQKVQIGTVSSTLSKARNNLLQLLKSGSGR